ncbi:hypothetical protein RMR16_024580 (plasmid) [Agrobacterium sp. rho-13.3]|uniref:hypothetical protein n=1 Tax=Agrobacterium sp. rho-13.3 TaxID=3072980 RepID=UPI002A0F4276|nr:hypothetical protein [Agrobacterium sp. rho-13.3]MDX8310130.1 hypothetical protein [Agrobacterium sp. rho-13.3]
MSENLARSSHGHLSAEEVRQTLSFLMPDLAVFWERPLTDYAYAVYRGFVKGRCSTREDAMYRLQQFIARNVLTMGASEEDARQASQQIAGAPVLQTGPHCHLLVEPDAFYTHLFSVLGLTAHSLRWNICYSCSTVKFTEKSKKGPGWLKLGDDVVNVFGLSRSRMDPSSICGFNGSVRFELSIPKSDKSITPKVARLKGMLPDTSFSSAAEAIKAANQILWQRFSCPAQRLLQFDDIDVADLVADHFEDPASWLSSHFTGCGLFPQSILHAMDKLNSGPWAGWIRQTTDFFWGLQDGRIFPLRLDEGSLKGGPSLNFDARFDPENIAACLRQRKLVPNLLMTFLVISILPGVRVLGGCRQAVYYPLMRHLVAGALEASGDFELLQAMRADQLPGMWGHRVLRPKDSQPFLELENNGSLANAAANYGDAFLMQCAGDLSSFTSDPIWAHMSAHIKNGTIHRGTAEWQWA